MLKRTTLAKSLLVAFSGTAALYGSAALAQQTTQELQRVTVTGSNIKRTDAETASPVETITREDIQRSGKTTIADVILGLNGNSNGSVPLSFGVGFAAGGSGVSLRGLGANNTLVLLNGRRMAPYGLADDGQRTFVDLSTIPLDAVERVEVVKDGASAIYGSDAIAGVVNIITRQDFKGVILNASYGQTRYGDGKTPKASITGGFGDMAKDKYNIFFTLEAQKVGEVRLSDRASRDNLGSPDLSTHGYDLGTGTGYGGYQVSNTSVSSSNYGYARPYTSQNGATAVAGSKYVQLATPAGCTTPAFVASYGYSGCTWNQIDYLQVQPKEDKLNFLTRGTVEILPTLSAFGEFAIFNSKVSTSYTPSTVSGSWADAVGGTVKNNTAITMGPNHPDNPFNAASGANGGLGYNARLRYATADFGGRDSTYDTTVVRLLEGLKGSAFNWDWEAGALYTQSTTKQTTTGYIRDSVLRDYLNGTNLSGMNPTNTYYRLGLNSSLNSAATNAAISPEIDNRQKTSIAALDLKATRELMQLPGGAMAVAVGAEFRREKTNAPPLPYTYQADIIGLGYQGYSASRNVGALYGELTAPVLSSLEVSAALRTDQYSDYGNSTTPKIGLKWTPIPQVVVRGTYAEGFRAPGPAESGVSVGGAAGYTNVVDPVRCPGGHLVAGAPAGDTSCNQQVLAISTANPLVKPETSKSFSLGLVLEPVKDTSVSIDYWQIKRKNEIVGSDPATVLLNPAGFPAATITRNTDDGIAGIANSGTLVSVGAPYTNGPSTKLDGVDVDLRQRVSLGEAGKLTGSLTFSHLMHFKRTQSDGTTVDYAGTDGPTVLSSSSGMPKDKATMVITWDRGPLSLSGTMNYVSGMKDIEFQGQPCLLTFADGSDAPGPGCKTPSFTTFDVTGKYQVTKALQIYGGITNLFDRVAPYDLSAFYGITHYNANYNQAGALGRSYSVGARYQFD